MVNCVDTRNLMCMRDKVFLFVILASFTRSDAWIYNGMQYVYNNSWTKCHLPNDERARYTSSRPFVSHCINPGRSRNYDACCRSIKGIVLVAVACSRVDGGENWNFYNPSRGVVTVYLSDDWGRAWGGAPWDPFDDEQRVRFRSLVKKWLTGPHRDRILFSPHCELQATELRSMLPHDDRLRVIAPPDDIKQAFEGYSSGKKGIGPWLRANGFEKHAGVE